MGAIVSIINLDAISNDRSQSEVALLDTSLKSPTAPSAPKSDHIHMPTPATSERELRAWAQRRGGRLLVVDDSAVERAVTASALAKVGFKVVMAGGGREAVEFIRSSPLPFDMVVMDISMPEVDGLAAARAIRQLPEPRGRVPIVALTANNAPGDRESCFAAGMNAYTTKPLSLAVLLRAMYVHLATESVGAGWRFRTDRVKPEPI